MNIMKSSPSNYEIRVLKSAIASRFLLLALILLWRSLLHPYDTSSPLNPKCLSSNSTTNHHYKDHQSIQFPQIASAIEDSIVWDSIYFVRIAECSYEYEQSYAFLPLLPIFMSLLSRTVFAPLVPLIGLRAVLALAGYVVNNIAFVLAALYLYRLSVTILRDPEAALRASILFCFNPASVFYSSIYTESFYSLFSFGGLYHVLSGANNIAVLSFALSGCARSNGVLNAGYFCFQTMHRVYHDVFVKRRASGIILGALRVVCIFLPFIAFQAYGYRNICHGRAPEEMKPWCKSKIPFFYSYVQSHYWGVGFLRYFQWKQLPNFLLASPILSLALCSIIHYVRLQPGIFFSLGFGALSSGKRSRDSFSSHSVSGPNKTRSKDLSTETQGNHNLRERKQTVKEDNYDVIHEEQQLFEKPDSFHIFIIPCILHLGFMAATAFFVMHVQVATRFLSASPPLYWFASYLMMSGGTSKRWAYMIWVYSAAYILLGSLLFSNFYPFT
ncbi:uncharacterized protein LOC126670207 isoform X2 [Mercurialis annua]|uniref:uncharacterized protein LOC126670207 isoform X2 n=1 Tax=Mercurialis annua TaxID=3986 RepID=UPI00215E1572|nr:uncharacterized protein LOC126670207 isoform X2 [Mercurialis annua]